MITVAIKEDEATKNLDGLKKVLRKEWTLKKVEINFKTCPHQTIQETWPLKLIFEDEDGEAIVLNVFSLTVGSKGPGTRELAKILNFFSVEYSEDDIFTERKKDENREIHLEYSL